jgi:hypothetical protein
MHTRAAGLHLAGEGFKGCWLASVMFAIDRVVPGACIPGLGDRILQVGGLRILVVSVLSCCGQSCALCMHTRAGGPHLAGVEWFVSVVLVCDCDALLWAKLCLVLAYRG